MKNKILITIGLCVCMSVSAQTMYEISRSSMQSSVGRTATVSGIDSQQSLPHVSFGGQQLSGMQGGVRLQPIGATTVPNEAEAQLGIRRKANWSDDGEETNTNPTDPGPKSNESPIGAAWSLLMLAAIYAFRKAKHLRRTT